MEQALEHLQALKPSQQDQTASFLLNELHEDERWTASTTAHAEKLESFIRNVLADETPCHRDLLDPQHR
jgi:predicted kinase